MEFTFYVAGKSICNIFGGMVSLLYSTPLSSLIGQWSMKFIRPVVHDVLVGLFIREKTSLVIIESVGIMHVIMVCFLDRS